MLYTPIRKTIMTTRQITAQIPAAYYDTIVTMFKGLGIDYKEKVVQVAPDSKKAVMKGIEDALVEYKTLRAAGRKGRPVEELIDEL